MSYKGKDHFPPCLMHCVIGSVACSMGVNSNMFYSSNCEILWKMSGSQWPFVGLNHHGKVIVMDYLL
jgi:hypothetical protein